MDLFDNDFLSVTGKRQASEHIIKRYGDFGWKLIKKQDDKLYGDVVHMSFTRPHIIKNKDELQLLQVRLEIAYNNTGKLARKCEMHSFLIGNLFALLGALFAVGGTLLIFMLGGLLPLIFGALLCGLGLISGVAGGIIAYRVYKKDKKKYALLIENEVRKIEELCLRARLLRGENE